MSFRHESQFPAFCDSVGAIISPKGYAHKSTGWPMAFLSWPSLSQQHQEKKCPQKAKFKI